MITLMSPIEFRRFYRMQCPAYLWAMRNPNGNEMYEQKRTDTISENLQAGQVGLAYAQGKEVNPVTLVFFYSELKDRIDRGEELFRIATGIDGVTMMSGNEFKRLTKIIAAAGEWCGSSRIEKARRVIDALITCGYQCRLTPEGLNAGMERLKEHTQGPDDYLNFILAFHNALAATESVKD